MSNNRDTWVSIFQLMAFHKLIFDSPQENYGKVAIAKFPGSIKAEICAFQIQKSKAK